MAANLPYEMTERDTTATDLTELRGDTGTGSGEATNIPRVLKQRFVLEEKLGSGGMGTVFRAKDLRKVEARDRDPYLAVKVLNNDFRAHPDAFVSLQREAAKSQALSHPNIVSIFDFDKDGEIPYMTMELLKGKELGELLSEYPNGLPDAMVWPIIEDVCAGLKRAHDAGIVHADFKPANVFVTDDHGAKILDFGIARAVHGEARFGDDAVFDPSKLAALTPAYASREMLLGETLAPTDDIYSLAVVVYMLLTGRHPYQRIRADEAEQDGLRPERIKKLSRRQWWVLARALDFHAEKRPQNLDEIIAGLVTRPALKPWMTGVLLVMAIGLGIGLSLGPMSEEREVVARDTLREAQSTRIDDLLSTPVFDVFWRDRVATELARMDEIDHGSDAYTATRARVLEAYRARIEEAQAFDAAFEVLRAANGLLDGARFEPGYRVLQQQVLAELETLLSAERFDRDWIDDVELQLLRFSRVFPGSTLHAELEEDVGDAYLIVIDRLINENELSVAAELFALTAPRVFEYDELEPLRTRLDRLRTEVEKSRAKTVDGAAEQRFAADLSAASGFVCQRLGGDDIAMAVRGLAERHPDRDVAIREGLARQVSQCVVSLAETDQQRARVLREAGIELLGPQAALVNLEFDPCSMRHLIGAGNSPGELGVCQDVLLDGSDRGPELVVIPNGESRFAIMRQVFQADEFAAFCGANGCPGPSNVATAGSVTRADAIAFSDWLSAETGRRYRLPSQEEWRLAMGDDAKSVPMGSVSTGSVSTGSVSTGSVSTGSVSSCDPDASVGSQNKFGLSGLAANTGEWVSEGHAARLAETPACSVADDGAADTDDARSSGVRLVREVR